MLWPHCWRAWRPNIGIVGASWPDRGRWARARRAHRDLVVDHARVPCAVASGSRPTPGRPGRRTAGPIVAGAVVDDEPWRAAVVRITTDRCGVEIRVERRHRRRDRPDQPACDVDGAAPVLLTTADGTTHPVRSIGVSSEVDLARLAAGGLPRGLSLKEEPSAPRRRVCAGRVPGGHEFSSRAAAVAEVDRGWGSPTRIVVSASTVRSFSANREAP